MLPLGSQLPLGMPSTRVIDATGNLDDEDPLITKTTGGSNVDRYSDMSVMLQLEPASHNFIFETSKLARMDKLPSLRKRVSSRVVECAHQLARITRV
jgi:hypothetical protein